MCVLCIASVAHKFPPPTSCFSDLLLHPFICMSWFTSLFVLVCDYGQALHFYMPWIRNNGRKRLEIASGLMDIDYTSRCQQPAVASADQESKLAMCPWLHLDLFFFF